MTEWGEVDRNVQKVVNFSKRGDETRKRFARKLYWRIFRLRCGKLYPLDLPYRNKPYVLNRLLKAKPTTNPNLKTDSYWFKEPMFCGFDSVEECTRYYHHLRSYCFTSLVVLVVMPVYLFGRGDKCSFIHKGRKFSGIRAPEMLIPTIGYRAFVRKSSTREGRKP